jgi:hypothetical protein
VQAEKYLKEICAALSLPAFSQHELTFLHKYIALMEPVAGRAMDTLQLGDQHACLGFALPTLKSLKNRTECGTAVIGEATAWRLAGINKRFGHLFNDTEFLLAAASYPKFETYWIDVPELKMRCSMLLLNAVKTVTDESRFAATLQTITALDTTDAGGDTDSSDLFNDLNEDQSDLPHLRYLQDSSRELGMPNKHPAVKKVFLRFNSKIPSSAPVERLFSTGAVVLTV